jgi:Fuc2NAc and GlcNAc transferase
MLITVALLSIITLLSLISTGLFIKYAVAKQMYDIPNARSSHKATTPRGGGVGFVLVFLISLISLMQFKLIEFRGQNLILLALFIVVSIGFFDDKYNLSAGRRISWQIIAAITAVFAVRDFLDFIYLIDALIVIYMVWMLNLYNFMDGIDGLASIEAISSAFGASLIFYVTGHAELSIIPLILGFATLGFFYWNFPKAKIFMGDVGSGFLGFVFSVLSIQALSVNTQLFCCWIVLLGVFIVDSSLTLLNRLINGEKIYIAHCNHAYQHAAKIYKSHIPVTVSTLIINLAWLCPIALLVGLNYVNGFVGILIAYIPLCILAYYFKAGNSLRLD